MELKDLNEQEQLVLAALTRFTVMSDGVVSENEAGEIDAIVAELGEPAWDKALDGARETISDQASMETALAKVDRTDAQELIYGTVLQIAIPDSIDPKESRLLELVAEAWKITTEFSE